MSVTDQDQECRHGLWPICCSLCKEGPVRRPSVYGATGPEAAKAAGVTYRQLDYWARAGLVRPSLAGADGSGTQRRYSEADIERLRRLKALLDEGFTLAGAIKRLS